MSFRPERCPFAACPSHRGGPFLWTRKGHFFRRCDGRQVPRFWCRTCRRTFSTQTFRFDYRFKRPLLHFELFEWLISKITIRQSARLCRSSRNTVTHRIQRIGKHCREMHLGFLAKGVCEGGRSGVFLLDELETFEHCRRLQPLTVPILIERDTGFVVHAESATLPCRGQLSGRLREKKRAREHLFGKRRSGSKAAVDRCFALLERFATTAGTLQVHTDRKSSYRKLLRERFGARVRHQQTASSAVRDTRNPLFMINHTCALVRDALSRLVRRNWAHSKKRAWLDHHLWIWIAYRNYLRGKINATPDRTPAMRIGLASRRFSLAEFFGTAAEFTRLAQAQ